MELLKVDDDTVAFVRKVGMCACVCVCPRAIIKAIYVK